MQDDGGLNDDDDDDGEQEEGGEDEDDEEADEEDEGDESDDRDMDDDSMDLLDEVDALEDSDEEEDDEDESAFELAPGAAEYLAAARAKASAEAGAGAGSGPLAGRTGKKGKMTSGSLTPEPNASAIKRPSEAAQEPGVPQVWMVLRQTRSHARPSKWIVSRFVTDSFLFLSVCR
jgi:hypothetical protein